MNVMSVSAGNRRFEVLARPHKLTSSYALESTAPHIVAARLSMNASGFATKEGSKPGQVEASHPGDASTQVVEDLYLQTLQEILRWENEQLSDPRGCCLPFVDVALDALTLTILEILSSASSQGLLLTADQTCQVLSKALPSNDDRPIIKWFYRDYVKRLLLFSLTQYADLNIGAGRYFQSLAQRNRYFFNTIFSCKAAIAGLDIPPSEQPTHRVSLEETVARTRKVADRIRSMTFVGGLAFPKLSRRIIRCGAENQDHALAENECAILLDGDSKRRNVLFRCDKIEHSIGAPLSSMSQDLVEVATYMYVGDTLVRRTARWRRSLSFIIPVRNPQRWKSVAEELSLITSFVSGDHIAFEFTQRRPIRFLFGVGLESASALEKGTVSKELRQGFEKQKISLSRDSSLTIKALEEHRQWHIYDTRNDHTFTVIKEDKDLNVYEKVAAQAEAKEIEPVSEDCVCLLSGGLDSFAGSLELILNGRQPVLVGHFKQGHVAKRQRMVADSLAELAKEYGIPKLRALRLDAGLAPGREKRHGFKGKLEYTQRLRSFLFLSLATAVADGLGLQEIMIPENGILALNVPLAACRTGSRSTRSAHPRFLYYFEKIINKLFDREQQFKIRNPLLSKTKAEVLEIFKDQEIKNALAGSISCSRYSYGVMMDKRRKGRECTHCGTCLACLIRRAAMITAGLADQDAEYIVQPFEETASLKEEERLGLVHLLEFCKAISDTPDDQKLLLRHPQLFLPDHYFPDASGESTVALAAACMYRQFANEVISLAKKMANERTDSPLLDIMPELRSTAMRGAG